MHEMGGFIAIFFSREMVELLLKGYEIISIYEFEEGSLPRKYSDNTEIEIEPPFHSSTLFSSS